MTAERQTIIEEEANDAAGKYAALLATLFRTTRARVASSAATGFDSADGAVVTHSGNENDPRGTLGSRHRMQIGRGKVV